MCDLHIELSGTEQTLNQHGGCSILSLQSGQLMCTRIDASPLLSFALADTYNDDANALQRFP